MKKISIFNRIGWRFIFTWRHLPRQLFGQIHCMLTAIHCQSKWLPEIRWNFNLDLTNDGFDSKFLWDFHRDYVYAGTKYDIYLTDDIVESV